MDNAYAERLRMFRLPYHNLGAIYDELARIMRDHAGEDVHQRRFAGAVLAEQRMDLAGPDIEIDVVQRAHAWEGLAYAFGRQNWKRAQRRLLRCCRKSALPLAILRGNLAR